MRDVLDINRNQIGSYDRIYSFEFKGKNRQVLLNPTDIFDLDADYHEYKELVFKDLDFIKSFNKLDISQIQSAKILSSLQNDVNLLLKNNFMDYSIEMHIIIRPYSSVKAPIDSKRSREKVLFSHQLDTHDNPSCYEDEISMHIKSAFDQDSVKRDSVSTNSYKKVINATYYNRSTGK